MTWPTKKLTDICDLERGTEPGSAFYIEASDKAVPFLRVGDLTGKVDAPRFVKNDNGNLQIVKENETLITFDGTPGIVVRGFNGAIASGIRVVKNIKQEVDGNFLFYCLQIPGVQKTIKAYSKGATIIHASSAIEHIKIPLPLLKTQKQIVERLDKIAEAQKLNNELIQKSDELFQSLLHRELNSAGKKWEVKKLGEVADFINGKAFKPKDWGKKGLPIIRIQNLNNKDADFNYYNGKVEEKYLVHDGDLLFSWSGNIGTSFGAFVWNGGNAILNQHIFKIKIKNTGLDKDYFYFFINKIIAEIEGKTHGITGLVHITKGTLEKVKILLPPFQIQKQIVAKLSAAQDYKTQLLAQRAKLKELFDSALAKSMTQN